MNFFDTYDIARAPTPQPSDANQPSLNEEFNEVVGQLGRFWGGFKRQVRDPCSPKPISRKCIYSTTRSGA
jgi:hypothetical protein